MKHPLAQFALPAFGLAGVALTLFSTAPYGIGMSPDSVGYLSAANNLPSSKSYTLFDGSPFVQWPPLYPTLLALFKLTSIAPLDGARWLNALCFGCILIITSRWASSRLTFQPLARIAAILVPISPPLVWVSNWAWTEPLFILLTLICLLAFERYLQNHPRALLGSAILAALACLTRYAGITLVISGLVLILFHRTSHPARWRVDAFAFAAISTAPLLVWLARNYFVSQTFFGERGGSEITLIENLTLALDTLSRWFLPAAAEDFRRVLFSAILGATAIVILWQLRQNQNNEGTRAWILPSTVFISIYTLYLVSSASTIAFDNIDNRLLSPVVVPLNLLIIFAADRLRVRIARYVPEKTANLLAFATVGFLFAFSLGYALAITRAIAKEGLGYANPTWKNSATLALLREHAPSGVLYANEPEAVYVHTGLPAIRSPRKFIFASPHTPVDDFARLPHAVRAEPPTHLVWFDHGGWNNLFTVEELQTILEMETIAQTSDGTIFRLKSKSR